MPFGSEGRKPGIGVALSGGGFRAVLFLSEQEQCELVNWGYAVADAAVRSYAADLAPGAIEAALPYPSFSLA